MRSLRGSGFVRADVRPARLALPFGNLASSRFAALAASAWNTSTGEPQTS